MVEEVCSPVFCGPLGAAFRNLSRPSDSLSSCRKTSSKLSPASETKPFFTRIAFWRGTGTNFHVMGHNFHLMRKPTTVKPGSEITLTAPARRSAAHAAVARAVAHHDCPAGAATRRIAHVVHLAHGIGGMIQAAIRHFGDTGCRRSRRRICA